MLRRLLMTLGVVLLAGCAHAQAPPPSLETATVIEGGSRHEELLNRLVGRWVLSGAIAGQDTVHDVDAAWVLQGNYVRIAEVSREQGENGRPAYEATVFVGWLQDHYVCIWLDNTEVASGEVTCAAAEAADSIAFEFRDAEGALIFTNAFVYNRGDDTWEWRMDNIRNGAPAPFARVTLRRQ